jgi:hypothetical protein
MAVIIFLLAAAVEIAAITVGTCKSGGGSTKLPQSVYRYTPFSL